LEIKFEFKGRALAEKKKFRAVDHQVGVQVPSPALIKSAIQDFFLRSLFILLTYQTKVCKALKISAFGFIYLFPKFFTNLLYTVKSLTNKITWCNNFKISAAKAQVIRKRSRRIR